MELGLSMNNKIEIKAWGIMLSRPVNIWESTVGVFARIKIKKRMRETDWFRPMS